MTIILSFHHTCACVVAVRVGEVVRACWAWGAEAGDCADGEGIARHHFDARRAGTCRPVCRLGSAGAHGSARCSVWALEFRVVMAVVMRFRA